MQGTRQASCAHEDIRVHMFLVFKNRMWSHVSHSLTLTPSGDTAIHYGSQRPTTHMSPWCARLRLALGAADVLYDPIGLLGF